MKSSASPSPNFQLLFESAPGLYLVLTSVFDIVAVSNAYLRATMTEREKILGRNLFEIFPDNPDDPAANATRNLRESLQRVLINKTADTMAVQKYDIRKPESEGGGFEERHWSPVNTPVFDDKEEIAYIIHRVEDVTDFINLKKKGSEQSKIAQELYTRAEKMEGEIFLRAQEVAEANRKLAKLYEKTKELDRLKTDFFANVSHELRTPLTLVLGPLARMMGDTSTPEPVRRSLEMIDRNAQILLKRVNDLLDISKLEAGKMSLEYAAIDLASLARVTLSSFESFARQRNIQMSIKTPHTLQAEADPEKLQRILLNLLSNALKFTPDDGKVELTLEQKGERALICISDTGPGIPPDMQETIFERFRQIDSGAQRRIGGTGLGLSIVKEFVTLHEGIVGVSNTPQGGACFSITIPLKAPQGSAVFVKKETPVLDPGLSATTELQHHVPAAKADSDQTRGAWVLIVEDNPDMNAFLAETLGKDHRVDTAFNGREGLEKALKSLPDLIISDVMMPEMSGDKMARELLSRPETRDIPLLLLTAKMDDPLKIAMLKQGVRDYISKPFSAEELGIKASRLIAERRKIIAERAQLIQRLTKSNEDLERFAYTASHDLRSPLRAVHNLSHMIEEDLGDTLEGEIKNHLTTLRQRVKRMEKLLDDILSYARLDGTEDNKSEIVNGETLVRDTISMLSPPKGFTILTGNELSKISIPRNPVQQALHNLIDNAIKHHDKKAGTITVDVRENSARYIFSVRDDGPGIAPEYHQRIFEMFQTLQPRDKTEGSGMGLAFVKKILSFHNCEVTVESQPGQGTEFRFDWPKKTSIAD